MLLDKDKNFSSLWSLRSREQALDVLGYIRHLLEMQLPIPTIAKLTGIPRRAIFRRLTEYNITVRELCSTVSEEELDRLVTEIKSVMPQAGYRLVRGTLKAKGYRVQWERLKASLHRVDTEGILSRMIQLGCIVRRSYSVPFPKSLVHIDTNHKLIWYNIVIFGGVDGFSRKIMYFGAANNNLASTTLESFEQAVQKVRRDQGVENVDVARLMFTVWGASVGSFIAGKSVHNQRLWRDVWMGVTHTFYDVLHTLEEEGHLDLNDSYHLFCCHYIFLPHLQASLDVFHDGWDDHPLSSEGNITPNQLWEIGQMQHPVTDPDNLEELHIPHIDWEESLLTEEHSSVTVPRLDSPLNEERMGELRATIDPIGPSD
ncbi:hypothetical protein SKAU_G00136350 [Synaphobranchus kaupii]|uniref:Integrase core domain-containing protein n=1 Tax=Synaphobranchus kaupii TaxID=118154 RepID=A0A9Q1J2V4_SYNKA|nr:hypothetical protein SKAU_G00136350 [Synaphobranchus kaupii]